jgi:hypothetical protein
MFWRNDGHSVACFEGGRLLFQYGRVCFEGLIDAGLHDVGEVGFGVLDLGILVGPWRSLNRW